MRKFLLPIINLVNLILAGITFGLGSAPAAIDSARKVNELCWYQLVWQKGEPNILGIVGFFLFVVAVALVLINFFPLKSRKFTTLLTGLMFVGAGVMFLLTPENSCVTYVELELQGALIAMAVLVFVAGALNILMSVLDFADKK